MRAVLASLLVLAACQAQASPQPRRFTLPDGLRVSLREDPGRFLFRARLRLAVKPEDIPAGKEGLLQLALRMVDRGQAGHLSPEGFERLLGEDGIRLERHLSAHAITWTLLCRDRDQDRAMGLLADRILRPVLDPGTLETERVACWAAQARRAPWEALLPDSPPAPTELGLGRISLEDLEAFLHRVFRPDRAVLALEGDLGLEQAKALVMLSFGTWTSAPGPTPGPGPAGAGPGTPPAPSTAQGGLALAPVPIGLPPALRDLVTLWLADQPALAAAWLPPAPDGTLRLQMPADGDLPERIAALRATPPDTAELDHLKSAWAGALQVRSLHPGALLQEDVRAVLGTSARPGDVAAVTLAQFQDALQRWLAPANLRWLPAEAATR